MRFRKINPVEDVEKLRATENICTKYLNLDFNLNVDTVLIKSGTGTGKTTLIKNFINKTPEFKSIQIITSRISLTNTLLNALDSLEDYRNNIQSDRCVRSIDSLYRYVCDEAPDLLVIDEFHSLMYYLTQSSTLDNRREYINEQFEDLIRYSEFLLITDANLTNSDIEYVLSNPNRAKAE